METFELAVEGMSCTGCEQTVTNAVKQVEGVRRVDADHEANRIEVTAESAREDEVEQAIQNAGFDVPA